MTSPFAAAPSSTAPAKWRSPVMWQSQAAGSPRLAVSSVLPGKDKLWKAKRSQRLERRLRAAGKHVETFYMANEAHILSMLAVDRVIARLVAFLDKVFATLSP
jgi:hypothetical protein